MTLPSFVTFLAPVWHEPSPGTVHAAVVVSEPHRIAGGPWLVKVQIVEDGRHELVSIDSLAPRRHSNARLHEFVAVFFPAVVADEPEAA